MEIRSQTVKGFSAGFIAGTVSVLVIGSALLYLSGMSDVDPVSAVKIPDLHGMLGWTYENLRLSVVPFFLTFVCYAASLARLNRLLRDPSVSAEKIAQAEHLVDIWINLFFGIGVIWTAIGMRGALLAGIGDLNSESAARLGAFSILQRLVEGGILLALSTTIFGAVGGYLLRLVKSLTVGARISAYYHRLAKQQAAEVNHVLQSIDARLEKLVATAKSDSTN